MCQQRVGRTSVAVASRGALIWELSSPSWEKVRPGIYRLAGTEATENQRAYANYLGSGTGAVVSHQSAAVLWGRTGFDLLPPRHVTLIEEFLVTRPARTVFDVAANSPFPQVEALLDRFWSDRLVTWSDMVETLDDLDRRASDLIEACGIVGLERQVDVGESELFFRPDLWLDRVAEIVLKRMPQAA